MKRMVTATSFAPVPQSTLFPSRRFSRAWRHESAVGSCWRGSLFVQIAVTTILLTLLLTAPARASSEPVSETRPIEIIPSVVYPAGTRLTIPGTEWSFVVPEQWQSSRPHDADMPFLIPETGKDLGMLFPLTAVTRESVREQLSEPDRKSVV